MSTQPSPEPILDSQTPASLRRLGQTSIQITPIGLGVMEFAGGGGLMGFAFPLLSQEEKNATVRAALNHLVPSQFVTFAHSPNSF